MNKEQLIDILMLLSALESWGMSNGHRLPEFLTDNLHECVESLRKELLK